MSYVKVHAVILDSSIWDEDSDTVRVWITLLAKANRDGVVEMTLHALARTANVSLVATEGALLKFLGPDPNSRTRANEGRRVEGVEGGWLVLNYEKYRERDSLEEHNRKNAQRQRRHRERRKLNGSGGANVTVTQDDISNDKAEAEAEAEAEAKRTPVVPPLAGPAAGAAPTKKPKSRKFPMPETWQPNSAHIELADKSGADVSHQAEQFRDHAMANRRLLVDWDAGFRNWLRKSAEFKSGAKNIRQVRPDAPRGSWMDANEHRFKNQRHGPPGGSDDPEAQKSPKSPKNPGSGPAKGTPEVTNTDEIPY